MKSVRRAYKWKMIRRFIYIVGGSWVAILGLSLLTATIIAHTLGM